MIAIDSPYLLTILRVVTFALLISPLGGGAVASDRDAAARVRDGVRLHQAGDFEQAAAAFAEAAETLPADPRVAFNQGCALARQGKHEEAESLLRDAALARDPELAADAYYNLGCLAADQLKTLLGDQPDEAVGSTRDESLLLVRTAVDHYRGALRANPGHTAARRNLELLRIWSKHIQDRWAQRDRERRREAMNVLEFLAWLQDEQRGVRSLTNALPKDLDSPQMRQAARRISGTQRDLTLEIEPLKVKLDAALQPPADAPSSSAPTPSAPPAAPSPEMEQARKVLHTLADQAGASMSVAAETLAGRDVSAAIKAQSEVLPPLNQLFELLAPFEAILQAAIKSETELVETSTLGSGAESAESKVGSAVGGDRTSGSPSLPEFEEAAEQQRFVSGWSAMLIRKAEQRVSELEAAGSPAGDEGSGSDAPTEIPLPTREGAKDLPADSEVPEPAPSEVAPPAGEPADEVTAGAPADDPTDTPPADPAAAFKKAIELGPQIKRLTREAADDLQQQAWSAALPKQQRALELLKEITDHLPPQENQEKQEQNDEQKQDQQNQDQKSQDDTQQQGDQDKPADDTENEQQEKEKSESKEKKDSADEEHSQDEQQKSSRAEDDEQADPKRSRQQAESLLRQVREREREHREFEKEIRRLLQSRIIVERDW